MRASMVAVSALALLAISASAEDKPAPKGDSEFKDLKAKISYSLGLDIGNNLKRQPYPLDAELIAEGIKDSVAGKPRMTPPQIQAVLEEFQREMRAKQGGAPGVPAAEKVDTEAALKNKKAGEEFLAANKTKPGIVTLPSGLQYQVVKEGTGPSPKPTDMVTVNYEGTLTDGTIFDSSYKRGEPTEFPVNRVIKGWTEALLLMKVGSKWKLFIPAELAYGGEARGAKIRPYDPLIFDVELLDVKKPLP